MNTAFPEQFFQRQDESADENFYSQPRFVTHIDDATISSLTEFYGQQIALEVAYLISCHHGFLIYLRASITLMFLGLV